MNHDTIESRRGAPVVFAFNSRQMHFQCGMLNYSWRTSSYSSL